MEATANKFHILDHIHGLISIMGQVGHVMSVELLCH